MNETTPSVPVNVWFRHSHSPAIVVSLDSPLSIIVMLFAVAGDGVNIIWSRIYRYLTDVLGGALRGVPAGVLAA